MTTTVVMQRCDSSINERLSESTPSSTDSRSSEIGVIPAQNEALDQEAPHQEVLPQETSKKFHQCSSDAKQVHDQTTQLQCTDLLAKWYRRSARDFPWRAADASAWGILVSEVMSQQTPMKRVEPRWRQWMQKWPRPADVATAAQAEILVAWGNLGYPRRALRLHECAQAIVDRHDGEVPKTYSELIKLPGVGDYTAAAVMCFAFKQRALVLDTNIRRVLLRVFHGVDQADTSITKSERQQHEKFLPPGRHDSVLWNQSVMELGALICRAQSPNCENCPISKQCLFKAQGRPFVSRHAKRQAWAGTDRQARGRVMGRLRKLHMDHGEPTKGKYIRSISIAEAYELACVSEDKDEQPRRVVESLLQDGLVIYADKERSMISLPSS